MPNAIANVKEIWQNCAKMSSLLLKYGLQFAKRIIMPIDTTSPTNTCEAPDAGSNVTNPHKISVETNLGTSNHQYVLS